MEITDPIIDKLAALSMLKFDADEKVQIKQDLQNMLGLVDKMNELDTNGVVPLLHLNEASFVRDDEVKNSITNEEAMLNANHKKEPHFIVPTVIKK